MSEAAALAGDDPKRFLELYRVMVVEPLYKNPDWLRVRGWK